MPRAIRRHARIGGALRAAEAAAYSAIAELFDGTGEEIIGDRAVAARSLRSAAIELCAGCTLPIGVRRAVCGPGSALREQGVDTVAWRAPRRRGPSRRWQLWRLWQAAAVAIVHRTTLTPSKLDLLTAWMPTQDWYRGTDTPTLAKAGGFRLDDPAGEVGIELMIVTDTTGPTEDAYLVPLTYRGAPAEGTLIGTMEHGVLGTRYAYDATTDPVFHAQVAALLRGEAIPQAQSESDTGDRTVHVNPTSDATDVAGIEVVRHLLPHTGPEPRGTVTASWVDSGATRHRAIVLRTT